MPPSSSKRARLAGRLHQEHQRLRTTLDALAAAAASGEWQRCDACWDPFAASLERHLNFEERLLFPPFAAMGTGASRMVKQLTDQHRALRAKASEVGLALQIHHTDPSSVARLVDELREHVSCEDVIFSPPLVSDHAAEAGAPTRVSGAAAGGLGFLGGLTVGAAAGAGAGPLGAMTGALLGSMVGAVAGATLAEREHKNAEHDAELDRAIGVIDGSLGEASPDQPPARIGAPSAAAAGVDGSSSDDAAGSISSMGEG